MAHLHLGLLAYWLFNTVRRQLKRKKSLVCKLTPIEVQLSEKQTFLRCISFVPDKTDYQCVVANGHVLEVETPFSVWYCTNLAWSQ